MPTKSDSDDEPKLTVIVADDDPTVQRAIEWVLRRSCEVIAKVPAGPEVVAAAMALQPDVIITDTMMPTFFGSQAIHRPNSARPFAVVLISDEPHDLRQWIIQGARCVVHTIDLDSDLATAVAAAARGSVFISRSAIGQTGGIPDTH